MGGHGIVVDSLFNVFFISDFTGTVTFSDKSANTIAYSSTSGSYDIAIFKLDSSGNFIWGKRTNESGDEVAYNLAIDGSSNLYLNGYFTGTFGFGSLSQSSNGSTDAFILKIDSAGNQKTLKGFGGTGADQNYFVHIDKSGLLYACGTYSGTASFGSNSLTSAGQGDAYFAKTKIDSSFTFLPNDTALCVSTSFTITPNIISSSYLWSTNATTQSISVTNTGWYRLRVLYNCDYLLDSIFVRFSYCGKCPNGTPTIGAELVNNGDFSAGNSGFNASPYVYDAGHSPGNPLTGGFYDVVKDASTIHFAWTGIDHTNGSGKFLAINGATAANYCWQETFNVKQNTVYSLSGWFNNLPEPVVYGGLPVACVHFRINGNVVSKTICINDYPDTWLQLDTFWNSGTNTSITLQIYNSGTAGNGNDFGIDDISFRECTTCSASASAGSDVSICLNDSIQLTASGGATYSWSPATGLSNPNIANPFAKPSTTTNYIVTASHGTCSSKDTVTVSVMVCNPVCFNCSSKDSINDSLLVCFPFNNNANDQSGKGNNGTPSNISFVNDRIGKLNSAASFNGSSSLIQYNPASLQINTYSYCAWVKLSALPASGNAFSIMDVGGSSNDQGILVGNNYGTQNGWIINSYGTNNISYASGSGTLPAINTWYFVCQTRDNTNVRLYVNGSLVASKTIPNINAGYSGAPIEAVIGARTNAASRQFFNGFIDDIRIYGKILSIAEINKLYNNAEQPIANAGTDKIICKGDSVQLLGSEGRSYRWSPGIGLSDSTIASPKASPGSTTDYILTVTNGICTANDTVKVIVNAPPSITANNDTTVCKGTNLNFTTTGTATRFLWSTGDTTASINITINKDTILWVRGQTGNSNCYASDTVKVIAAPFPIIKTNNDTSICKGNSILLTTSGNANKYLWSTGDTLSSVNVTITKDTMYWVRGQIGNNACYTYDTVLIKALQYFPVNLGKDTVLCNGDIFKLNALPGIPRVWSTSDTTQSINVNVVADIINYLPQKIWVKSGIGNCISTDTILIYALSKPKISVLLNGKTSFCLGGTVSLGLTNIPPWSNIKWSTGDTSKTLIVSPLQTTTYFVTYFNNECGFKDSITITILSKPVITLSPDDSICPGESSPLKVRGASSYLWNNGAVDSNLNVSLTKTTTYWVIGSNGSCISDTQKVTVTVIPKPKARLSANPVKGTVPLSVQFTNISVNATGYLWYFGDGDTSTAFSPKHIYLVKGKYTALLIAFNSQGCSDTVSAEIIADDMFIIYIPNVFTPDGDGLNEAFEIYTEGIKSLEGQIYNRWGELLYTWEMPGGKWWDGTYHDRAVPDGVYLYLINVKDTNNNRHIYKGPLTIIR